MPTTIADIKLLVRDLLRNEYDDTNHPKPVKDSDIHTGWWDDGKAFPQITITADEEGVLQGGDTGVTGISANGYVQHRNGTVLVDCWAGSSENYESVGLEQVQLKEMMDQIEEIIFNNLLNLQYIDSIAITNRTKLIDEEADPTEHRCQFELTYNWTKE